MALTETAHLVIGGGLAGSMAALRLAAAGREVTLLERERAPHPKVCGEFLSREAVDYLRQAGIDPVALGAQPIGLVRVTSGRRLVQAALPFPALSLSRAVLDEALLARAAQQGCRIVRGAFVESITAHAGRWQAHLRDGDAWSSPAVFLASGKHDVRGLERSPVRSPARSPAHSPAPTTGAQPNLHGDLVGFKMLWQLAPAQTEALRNCMELYLFSGGYGGLSLVEGDAATLCLVLRRARLRALGGWPALLAHLQQQNPHIAERLSGAAPLWERPLAIASIPYGYLAQQKDGLWRIGDQAACIPSFTGDGMSIALHSASLAAEMYLAGASAAGYQQALRTQLKPGMRLATTLSRTMVTAIGRALAPIGLAAFPSAIGWIATSTRIPDRALQIHANPRMDTGESAAI